MRSSYTRGVLVMTASSLLFSAMSFVIPFARDAGTFVLASARFLVGGLIILVMGVSGMARLRPVNWPWLVVRGLFGAVSVYLFYYGILKIGLGMGTILNNTYPVFAALLAPVVLREKLKPDVLAVVVVSFIGICLIVDPEGIMGLFHAGGAQPPLFANTDTLLALLGGVLASVAVVAVKKLHETDTSPVIFLAQCVFGLLVFGYPTAAGSFAFDPRLWLLLALIGVLATASQLVMTYAYKYVPATEGSLLSFLTPVINVILGALLFGETMHPLAIAGSGVVLAGCVYVALRDRILRPAA